MKRGQLRNNPQRNPVYNEVEGKLLKYITACKLQFSANLFPRPIYLLGKRNKSSLLVGYSASAERLQLCSSERGIWELRSKGAPVSASPSPIHPGPPPLCSSFAARGSGCRMQPAPTFPPVSFVPSRSPRHSGRLAGARDAGLSPGCPGAAGAVREEEGWSRPRWLMLEEGRSCKR